MKMIKLNATIMGIPLTLHCQENEEHQLREAIAYLDSKMCAFREEKRKAKRVLRNDEIAIFVALQMTAQLLSVKAPNGPLSDFTLNEIQQKMANMHKMMDKALTPQEDLF